MTPYHKQIIEMASRENRGNAHYFAIEYPVLPHDDADRTLAIGYLLSVVDQWIAARGIRESYSIQLGFDTPILMVHTTDELTAIVFEYSYLVYSTGGSLRIFIL